MANIIYPEYAHNRGPGYWLRPGNLWASRRKLFRPDHSIEWRQNHTAAFAADQLDYYNDDARCSVPFSALLDRDPAANNGFRFIIMGDTGEGDRSQYGLVPLLRALRPEFILIAGDIVYPSGKTGRDRNSDDYLAGFFEPYANLGIPIWSIPGNHEYYSKDNGGGYFETFCGTGYAKRWQNFGLRLVRQPGSFWELREPSGKTGDLVVIGIDTGLHGNIDGHRRKWNNHRTRKFDTPDSEQLSWLHQRLKHAQRMDNKVIIMFHIPSLADQEHRSDCHLNELYRTIAAFPCVRLVVAGHVHNWQWYSPDTFARYLQEEYSIETEVKPYYAICGGGGAYLTTTDFDKRDYPCETAFPSRDDWRNNVGRWTSIVERLGWSRTIIGRIAGALDKGPLSDADLPAFLSVLLVEVKCDSNKNNIVVTPVFLRHVNDLFAHLPKDQIVRLQDDTNELVSMEAVNNCLQEPVFL